MANNRLFLVFREPGPTWAAGVPTRQQRLWGEHAAFMDDLFAKRRIVLAGPYAVAPGALVILAARDAGEVSALLSADPWETAGIMQTERIVEWVVYLDSRKSR